MEMNAIKKTWNIIKTEPEIWFFYIFLMTFTLQARKVIVNYPLSGRFNEYAGIYIYLSDIFLLLTIGIWASSILYNISKQMSISKFVAVTRGTNLYILIIPATLILWSLITSAWALRPDIAVYRSVKLFEFYLLFLFLALHPRCSTWNIIKYIFWIIIISGFVQSVVAIVQFIIQGSIGFYWLKESYLSANISGVADIIINGNKYIRSYGLFPHPNILGGFLLMSIMLTLAYNRSLGLTRNVPRGTFMYILLTTQIVAGILTFSKSFIIGIFIAIAYFLHSSYVSCRTFTNHSLKFIKNFINKRKTKIWVFTLCAIMLIIGLRLVPDFKLSLIKSINDRLIYLNIAKEAIYKNFLLGVGSGQFVLEMQHYSSDILSDWQFQPVHNIFILILSELGLVGLFLFMWTIWNVFHVEQLDKKSEIICLNRSDTKCEVYIKKIDSYVSHETIVHMNTAITSFKSILIGFFVIALFDHYLWDIQQGQIMLWMTLGLLAGHKSIR